MVRVIQPTEMLGSPLFLDEGEACLETVKYRLEKAVESFNNNDDIDECINQMFFAYEAVKAYYGEKA